MFFFFKSIFIRFLGPLINFCQPQLFWEILDLIFITFIFIDIITYFLIKFLRFTTFSFFILLLSSLLILYLILLLDTQVLTNDHIAAVSDKSTNIFSKVILVLFTVLFQYLCIFLAYQFLLQLIERVAFLLFDLIFRQIGSSGYLWY